MAKEVGRYISELIEAYQTITKKTYTEIALDLDVTRSNFYRYRNGSGNPRAKTVDKIVRVIEDCCPEAYKSVDKE